MRRSKFLELLAYAQKGIFNLSKNSWLSLYQLFPPMIRFETFVQKA